MSGDSKSKLKVGSKIVEQGKVYRIYKIETRNSGGTQQRILHYKPYFKSAPGSEVTCSIPEDKLPEASIRIPHKKDKIAEILQSLGGWKRVSEEIQTDMAKDLLNKNSLRKTAGVLKVFWKEKQNDEESTMTKSRRDLLETAIERMVQEIAIVTGTTIEKAEAKIKSALK